MRLGALQVSYLLLSAWAMAEMEAAAALGGGFKMSTYVHI